MSVKVKRKCNGKEESFVLFPNTETERIFYVAVKIYVREHVGVACSFLICLYGNTIRLLLLRLERLRINNKV